MRDAALQSVAVGCFDGVHLGHQAILSKAASVLTFDCHPLSVLAPERAPRQLMGLEDRLAVIGLPTEVLSFTPELAALSPEEFAKHYLRGRKVVCGENWHFGKGGVGNADWLRAHGYEVEVVGYAEYRGERISSSRIRESLARGELDDVRAMLGRAYMLSGKVVAGKHLGRELGYPTVNVQLASRLALSRGAYSVRVEGVRAIANYGVAPTMGELAWKDSVLEIHFLDEVPNIAERVSVEFVRFLRPERKFESPEALQRQIAEDIANL